MHRTVFQSQLAREKKLCILVPEAMYPAVPEQARSKNIMSEITDDFDNLNVMVSSIAADWENEAGVASGTPFCQSTIPKASRLHYGKPKCQGTQTTSKPKRGEERKIAAVHSGIAKLAELKHTITLTLSE